MIAQFALRLICGMSLMWALMPRRQVTSGFFRIQMLVVMGLGTLAVLTVDQGRGSATTPVLPTSMALGLSIVIAAAAFFGSVLWTLERRSAGEWVGFVLCVLSSAITSIMNLSHESIRSETWDWSGWLTPLSDLSGAAILGATVVGMLLGHWYLTTPTMSIEPLKRINLFVGVAGVVRLVVSTLGVVGLWFMKSEAAKIGSELPASMTVPPAWLGLRWLAGVIGPIVVSLMVWRILKYRNTQAATGVLFVGVILAFIGDMTAALLLRETGLPL